MEAEGALARGQDQFSICRAVSPGYLAAMSLLTRPKPVRRAKATAKPVVRAKKLFKFELTAEDIALDNAISTAAARSLVKRSA